VVGRALRVRNSVTKCAFLTPVIERRFCNGPLISQHFHRPVTPEVGGSSPVAPAKKSASNQRLSIFSSRRFSIFGRYHCPPLGDAPW
jgi:hypothetical protein